MSQTRLPEAPSGEGVAERPAVSEERTVVGRRSGAPASGKMGCARCWALVSSPIGTCPICRSELVEPKRWHGTAPDRSRVWVQGGGA